MPAVTSTANPVAITDVAELPPVRLGLVGSVLWFLFTHLVFDKRSLNLTRR
jgi:hypothetical protein